MRWETSGGLAGIQWNCDYHLFDHMQMEVQAKSRPIPINEPILAEFHKGKKVYSGQFIISSFPDPIDSNPVVDFTGTGELTEH